MRVDRAYAWVENPPYEGTPRLPIRVPFRVIHHMSVAGVVGWVWVPKHEVPRLGALLNPRVERQEAAARQKWIGGCLGVSHSQGASTTSKGKKRNGTTTPIGYAHHRGMRAGRSAGTAQAGSQTIRP